MALSASGVTHLCCPGQGGEKDQGGIGSLGWDGMSRPRGIVMVLQAGMLGSPCLPMPADPDCTDPPASYGQRVCLRPPRHLPDPHHHKECTIRMPQGPTYPSGAGDTAAGLPPPLHVPSMHQTSQSRSPCWDLVPAVLPGDTGLAAGTGCEAVARGESQVNLPLELPSANNKTMPGRGRLRNQRRGGEVVIFGFSPQ